jgi:hypothetical protein
MVNVILRVDDVAAFNQQAVLLGKASSVEKQHACEEQAPVLH